MLTTFRALNVLVLTMVKQCCNLVVHQRPYRQNCNTDTRALAEQARGTREQTRNFKIKNNWRYSCKSGSCVSPKCSHPEFLFLLLFHRESTAARQRQRGGNMEDAIFMSWCVQPCKITLKSWIEMNKIMACMSLRVWKWYAHESQGSFPKLGGIRTIGAPQQHFRRWLQVVFPMLPGEVEVRSAWISCVWVRRSHIKMNSALLSAPFLLRG